MGCLQLNDLCKRATIINSVRSSDCSGRRPVRSRPLAAQVGLWPTSTTPHPVSPKQRIDCTQKHCVRPEPHALSHCHPIHHHEPAQLPRVQPTQSDSTTRNLHHAQHTRFSGRLSRTLCVAEGSAGAQPARNPVKHAESEEFDLQPHSASVRARLSPRSSAERSSLLRRRTRSARLSWRASER